MPWAAQCGLNLPSQLWVLSRPHHTLCSTSSCGSQVFPNYWTSCHGSPRHFHCSCLPAELYFHWDTAQISPTLLSRCWQHRYPLKAKVIHPSLIWSQPSVNCPIMTFNTPQNKSMCTYLCTYSSHPNLQREGWGLFIRVPSPYPHSSHIW